MKERIMELYIQGIRKVDIAKKLNISRQTVSYYTPTIKIKKNKVKDDDIKKLWDEGNTMTYIAGTLKIGAKRVKETLIRIGVDDPANVKRGKPVMKMIDTTTGKVKVKINRNTWCYMDASKWDCENRFREFKIKQLGLYPS